MMDVLKLPAEVALLMDVPKLVMDVLKLPSEVALKLPLDGCPEVGAKVGVRSWCSKLVLRSSIDG
jgi:hypothetical protein